MNQDTILRQLEELGCRPGDRTVLFFVPVALVAWADGDADRKEVDAVAAHHRRTRCGSGVLCMTEPGRKFFYYHFLYQKPDPTLSQTLLNLLKQVLAGLTEEEQNDARELIARMCLEVARASGSGMLRALRPLSRSEKDIILDLAATLKLRDAPGADRVLTAADI